MRLTIAWLFCGALLAQTPAQLCSVQGTVRNGSTNDPLKDVALTLRRASPPAVFVTESDEHGHYAFAGIEPGQYTLGAEKNGFLKANYGARSLRAPAMPLVLDPGRNMTGVDLKVQPQSVVAGRVFDADGDPPQDVQVRLLKSAYSKGVRQFTPVATARTNDLGEYRLSGLTPGVYYLQAADTGHAGSEDRSAKPRRDTNAPTYYPSTTEMRFAKPVELAAGEAANGIDVNLVRVPTASLSGRIENPTGVTPVYLVLFSSGPTPQFERQVDLGRAGDFQIDGVAVGKHWLVADASARPTGEGRLIGQQLVDVTGTGVEGITVTIGFRVKAAGTVRVEGAPPNMRSLRIILGFLDPLPAPATQVVPSAGVGEDGNFAFDGIFAERYAVTVAGLPPTHYVKSIRAGDSDVLAGGFDLTQKTPGAIQIVLSDKAAKLEGSVKDEKGDAAPATTVALVPQGASVREQWDLYRSATADEHGGFSLAGLPPGEYKLFAWTEVEDGAWMDAEFLKPYQGRGKLVTVREGGSETVELKVITAK